MKYIHRLYFFLGFILSVPGVSVFSQIAINTDGSQPDGSAMLDVKSKSKGLLLPRMTHAELNTISNPADGLMVYCTDCGSNGLGSLSMFKGGGWYILSTNCLNPLSPVAGTHVSSGNQIVWNWNIVPYATGYKWNTINDYASATDMGTSITKTETGLTPNITYTRFVWAYNTCGVSVSTTLCQTLPYLIGQSYGGGIIFYIDGTGQHGLISATSDQSTGAEWGCGWTAISTSTSIGSGQTNTTNIVNGCSTAGIAARICDDLVLNGYNDWFLPSRDELTQMCVQKAVVGGFTTNPYWSSSGAPNASYAYNLYFQNCSQWIYAKSNLYFVRAVRAF
jgi:hypothetical protein